MDNLLWYHLGKQHGGGGGVESEVLTVPLDMTGAEGQIIVPSEGKLLSQVTIEKPDTLIPENIAEGIDIAGIIGTLAAGGGGGAELKVASGTVVASSSSPCTVTHNLGVIPNIVLIQPSAQTSGSTAYFSIGVGLRIEGLPKWSIATTMGTVKALLYRADLTAAGNNAISYATETTFRFGTASYPPYGSPDVGYNWWVLGGLD